MHAHTEVSYSRISDRPLLYRELPPPAEAPTHTHTHTHTHTNHPPPMLSPTILPTHSRAHTHTHTNFSIDRMGKLPYQHLFMKLLTETQTNEILETDPQNYSMIGKSLKTHTHTHTHTHSLHTLLFDTCRVCLLVSCQPAPLLLWQANKLARETWPLFKERASPGNWNLRLD